MTKEIEDKCSLQGAALSGIFVVTETVVCSALGGRYRLHYFLPGLSQAYAACVHTSESHSQDLQVGFG